MASVKVTGLLPEDDDDTVQMYFESRSRSGGGEVVSFERRDGGRTAIVTFKENVVAGRVVSQKDHFFLGRPIQATLHKDDVSGEACTVRVTGLDPGLEDDTLEMHFEIERRSGGGAIKALQRRKGGTEAVITFEEGAVAQRVEAWANPTIRGRPVSISFCKDDVSGEACTVRVTGLDPGLEDDTLEMHFEIERRSGGGAIKALQRRKGGTEAVITFKEGEVAKRVVSKSNQEIRGRPVRVERYDGSDSGGTGGESAVKVTGLPPEVDNDLVEMYFESKRKSGGGDISKTKRKRGGRTAIIVFQEGEVGSRVSSQKSHVIKGQPIKVVPCSPDEDVPEEPPSPSFAPSAAKTPQPVKKVAVKELDDENWTSIPGSELRIVLMGHTGSGISASGNTILGQKAFESRAAAIGVTMKLAQRTAQRFGKKMNIVDTPGLFDPNFNNRDVIKEITKCIGMTAPGPHAFIMVVSAGRFTKEEYDTITEFKKYFGDDLMKYLIILFTRVDDLDGKPLEEFVREVPGTLAKVLQECDYNYFGFNNRATPDDKDRQVRGLLEKIHEMLEKNGGSYYTKEMLEAAEEAMKRREHAIRKELEEQKRKEIEAINAAFVKKCEEREKVLDETMKQKTQRIQLLESIQRKGELSKEASSELKALKSAVLQMTEQRKKEEKERLEQNAAKIKELRGNFEKLKQETRDIAGKEVEEKKEGLSLVWDRPQNVGWGLVSSGKSLKFW